MTEQKPYIRMTHEEFCEYRSSWVRKVGSEEELKNRVRGLKREHLFGVQNERPENVTVKKNEVVSAYVLGLFPHEQFEKRRRFACGIVKDDVEVELLSLIYVIWGAKGPHKMPKVTQGLDGNIEDLLSALRELANEVCGRPVDPTKPHPVGYIDKQYGSRTVGQVITEFELNDLIGIDGKTIVL